MIKLSEKISNLPEEVKLGLLRAQVKIHPSDDKVVSLLEEQVVMIEEKYTLENYKNETLEASRKAYRALGKDPSRYRISSDSLFRRIIKKKGVYFVNNVVDINNIISLKTLWSIGAYDFEKIQGEIIYGVGTAEDVYKSIGRGDLNIEYLPVLIDEIGPFGSATSDSLRTMVTKETKEILMVIHAFGNDHGLMESLEELKHYLTIYADAENIEIYIK